MFRLTGPQQDWMAKRCFNVHKIALEAYTHHKPANLSLSNLGPARQHEGKAAFQHRITLQHTKAIVRSISCFIRDISRRRRMSTLTLLTKFVAGIMQAHMVSFPST